MSQLFNKAIQPIRTLVFTQQKRFRAKINIQKPKKSHPARLAVEIFTKPFISNPASNLPLWERCNNIRRQERQKIQIVNPYENILAKECMNWFNSSNMTAIFHVNSITEHDKFDVAVALKKENMYLKHYQKKILKIAFPGTNYEVLMNLIQDTISESTYFVFSPEIKTEKLYKITKKAPQFLLLAGILHGKLLSRDALLKYGQLDLTTAQAGLVQVLRAASGGNLNRQLTHHQSTLVTRLKQIGTIEEGEKDKPCDAKE
ncbi:39S ribosomal protein L10, mitochondrial isoform X2 [Copidosoma floridanum]|uniref:39S ribosomal protein L10, mitochondrial isoform X2 n=1 Tax=Copidosoma floridanum TaxID=29053 RepID=UPI0006C9899F|nr:39S ribosomal protein L10, mitochondrial isoform X2 [Copidosoma floridanum]